MEEIQHFEFMQTWNFLFRAIAYIYFRTNNGTTKKNRVQSFRAFYTQWFQTFTKPENILQLNTWVEQLIWFVAVSFRQNCVLPEFYSPDKNNEKRIHQPRKIIESTSVSNSNHALLPLQTCRVSSVGIQTILPSNRYIEQQENIYYDVIFIYNEWTVIKHMYEVRHWES